MPPQSDAGGRVLNIFVTSHSPTRFDVFLSVGTLKNRSFTAFGVSRSEIIFKSFRNDISFFLSFSYNLSVDLCPGSLQEDLLTGPEITVHDMMNGMRKRRYTRAFA